SPRTTSAIAPANPGSVQRGTRTARSAIPHAADSSGAMSAASTRRSMPRLIAASRKHSTSATRRPADEIRTVSDGSHEGITLFRGSSRSDPEARTDGLDPLALAEQDDELVAQPSLSPTQRRLQPSEAVTGVLDASEGGQLQGDAEEPQGTHRR